MPNESPMIKSKAISDLIPSKLVSLHPHTKLNR